MKKPETLFTIKSFFIVTPAEERGENSFLNVQLSPYGQATFSLYDHLKGEKLEKFNSTQFKEEFDGVFCNDGQAPKQKEDLKKDIREFIFEYRKDNELEITTGQSSRANEGKNVFTVTAITLRKQDGRNYSLLFKTRFGGRAGQPTITTGISDLGEEAKEQLKQAVRKAIIDAEPIDRKQFVDAVEEAIKKFKKDNKIKDPGSRKKPEGPFSEIKINELKAGIFFVRGPLISVRQGKVHCLFQIGQGDKIFSHAARFLGLDEETATNKPGLLRTRVSQLRSSVIDGLTDISKDYKKDYIFDLAPTPSRRAYRIKNQQEREVFLEFLSKLPKFIAIKSTSQLISIA